MNPGADELKRAIKRLEEVSRGSNKYDVAACCTICEGVVRHEPWCVIINKDVEYAFLLAVDPAIITEGDQIGLHSLGVRWHPYAGEETH
jgi:hypothetical protein